MAVAKEELNRAFFVGYGEELLAEEECYGDYSKDAASDLYPNMRRAKIESKVFELAADYDSVEASAESNKTRTSHHTKLKSGNVILTIHKTATTKSLVRPAKYRNTYAQSAQLSLFEENQPPPTEASLYACLKYGVGRKRPKILAFAVVDFPDEKGKVIHSLNLLAMSAFSSIPTEFIKLTATEVISDDLELNLRSDARSKKQQEQNGTE